LTFHPAFRYEKDGQALENQAFTPEQLLAMLFVNLKATGLSPTPLLTIKGLRRYYWMRAGIPDPPPCMQGIRDWGLWCRI
jgi:hypothetical protein